MKPGADNGSSGSSGPDEPGSCLVLEQHFALLLLWGREAAAQTILQMSANLSPEAGRPGLCWT